MSLENMIPNLKKMRFLAHEDDSIEVLEEILNEISQTADNTVIGDLCSVFHDEIDEPSIIGDLIETIFGSVAKFEKSINRLVNEEQGLGSS
jgi:hypothetical protein